METIVTRQIITPTAQTEQRVQAIVGRVREVAVLPQVIHQVIELTGNMSATGKDIERAVGIDPGLSARLLTLANSAYYALPRKVGSVKEAVMFLGFKTIRQLAMTAGCFDLFVGKTDRDSLRRRTWWRHAIDTAVCARLLATCVPDCSPDEAYAAGLLHDIGKTLLDRYGQASYQHVEELIAQGWETRAAEHEVYGCDHTLLGATIGAHWRLPETLVEAIGGHHDPPEETASKRLIAVVATANVLSQAFSATRSISLQEEEPIATVPLWARDELGMAEETVSQAIHACRTALDTSSMLSNAF